MKVPFSKIYAPQSYFGFQSFSAFHYFLFYKFFWRDFKRVPKLFNGIKKGHQESIVAKCLKCPIFCFKFPLSYSLQLPFPLLFSFTYDAHCQVPTPTGLLKTADLFMRKQNMVHPQNFHNDTFRNYTSNIISPN